MIPLPAAPALAHDNVTPPFDARELTRKSLTLHGRPLPQARPSARTEARRASPATPALGTVRSWVGLDDTASDLYRKDYTLRAVGEHIEVWVAKDLSFPKGDCRKPADTEITDKQIADLVHEFDTVIYPAETKAFSTPVARTGAKASVPGDYTGDGHKTVTLVDNIRDDNFHKFPERPTYIAGFFSPQLNELFDRNVMTIDAYDWKHRLGDAPPDDPTDDLCTSRPARPRMYEGTFAHEWQHLLEQNIDPQEVDWVNEGLSDYAQTLVGYVDGRLSVHELGFDNHLACFQGFGNVKTRYNVNPRMCGGPQNSLNLWTEGEPNEVLADYGNAYQLMLYLHDRFGAGLLSALHRDRERRGLAALKAALPADADLYDVLHDFQIMTLVDKAVGRPGGQMIGLPRARVTSASLRSTVNLADKSAYDRPGAAPNGADYVPLPSRLRSVEFTGARTLPPEALAWTVDAKMLFSGNEPSRDVSAVRAVDVPREDPVLRFTTTYGLEEDFDFGYVTVSTDGGKTYQVVAGEGTRKGPLGAGLTGKAADVKVSYDLSAHAGKRVLLGFRYVSDASVNLGGWHIGEVAVGATKIAADRIDGWQSPTQIRPVPVHGWHVTLVGLNGRRARAVPVEEFAKLRDYPKVVAVVAYDEPTEQITQYARYALKVNGELQPGGGTERAGGAAQPAGVLQGGSASHSGGGRTP